MKKVIAMFLSLVMVVSLVACSGENVNPLDSIEGATAEQKETIQKVLDDNNITVKSCREGSVENSGDETADSVTQILSAAFIPYDITDENGKEYRITLNKEDMSVIAIVDISDGSFVYGGLSGLFGNNE